MILLKLSYPVQLARLAAVLLPEQVQFSVEVVHPEDTPTCLEQKSLSIKLIPERRWIKSF